MRRPLLLAAAVAAALGLALATGCSGGGLGGERRPSIVPAADRPAAPGFALPALDGEGQVRLADHRGRLVVVNFWASWCEPCREEMPALARLSSSMPEVDVIGLAVNDRPADSRSFARSAAAGYTLGIDRDADVAARYGVSTLPVTVVVDRRGRIASTVFGPVSQEGLEEALTTLGAPPPAPAQAAGEVPGRR